MPGGHKQAKREAALAALLSEPDIDAAARKAGIGSRTLQLWLSEAEFKNAYRALRLSVLERCVGRLVGASVEAITALVEALQSQRTADRIKAASAILSHSGRSVERLDVVGELERLKAIVEGLQHDWQQPHFPAQPGERPTGNGRSG
jgi:hypothetical protein